MPEKTMRISLFVPTFVLAAAATVAADNCAVCPTTLLPGVAEIVWTLVFNRNVAENVMFCGYACVHQVTDFCRALTWPAYADSVERGEIIPPPKHFARTM